METQLKKDGTYRYREMVCFKGNKRKSPLFKTKEEALRWKHNYWELSDSEKLNSKYNCRDLDSELIEALRLMESRNKNLELILSRVEDELASRDLSRFTEEELLNWSSDIREQLTKGEGDIQP